MLRRFPDVGTGPGGGEKVLIDGAIGSLKGTGGTNGVGGKGDVGERHR